MSPSDSVKLATIDTVRPGTIFAVDLGQNDVTFCMAVAGLGGGELPGLVAIYPGHPSLQGRPGLLHGSVIHGQSLVVYPTAKIVPSPHRDHLVFDRYRRIGSGGLALYEDGLAIVAAGGHNSLYAYSCVDGSPRNVHAAKVFFRSWEIMIDGPGGEPYSLCVVSITEP